MTQKHDPTVSQDLLHSTIKMVGLSCLTALVIGSGLVYWTTSSRDHLFQTAIERGIDLDQN